MPTFPRRQALAMGGYLLPAVVLLTSNSVLADTSTEGAANPATKAATQPAEGEQARLTVGSTAPVLAIEHWVQDGEGKFKPVTDFKQGEVYVVEFWATWCGPCLTSMPHLAELQQQYTGKGVTVVSVSDEPLETVNEFLKRELPDYLLAEAHGEEHDQAETEVEVEADASEAQPTTFGELTKPYCLTTDPDKSVYDDYMTAAGQNGIPCAFIVGKQGVVEWIGHPVDIDSPLQEVVADKWDRDAFAEEFKAEQRIALISEEVRLLLQAGNIEQARAVADKLVAETPPGSPLAAQIGQVTQMVLMFEFREQLSSDLEAAEARLASLKQQPEASYDQIMGLVDVLHSHASSGGEATAAMYDTALELIANLKSGSEEFDPTLAYYEANMLLHKGAPLKAKGVAEKLAAELDGQGQQVIGELLKQINDQIDADKPSDEAAKPAAE